jgi:methanethiol S-methyltransferase
VELFRYLQISESGTNPLEFPASISRAELEKFRGDRDCIELTFSKDARLMKRWSFFVYGVFCHLLFLVTFAYLVGFVGNLVVPKSIDSTPSEFLPAFVCDLLLILLFGLQHSIMARPWFKRHWTRLVPEPIERSTYVLLSCAAVGLLMWQWRSLDGVLWNVENPVVRGLLWGLFAIGWLLVPVVSLMINHFDLFGTRQVWLYLNGRPYTELPFRTPLLYNRVRHPLYLGFALAMWATPTMSVGHLLFAGALTAYMALAAHIEERALVGHFGDKYRHYTRRVPMFLPRIGAVGELPPADQPVEENKV